MISKVDEFINAKVIEKYRPIVAKFRSLISNEFPFLKEEMRGGTEKYHGVPVYRSRKIIITVSPTKNGITFSFSEGKKFEDKYGLLEGEGNKSLNLRVGKPEDCDDEMFRYYIQQAVDFDS